MRGVRRLTNPQKQEISYLCAVRDELQKQRRVMSEDREVVRRAHTRERTKVVHHTWAPRACARRRGRPSTPWAPACS